MSKPTGERYTVAVDFDGVLHSYTSSWVNAHTIPDPPVEGAISWLAETIQRFDVVIHTTRARTWRGRRAVRRWLAVNAGTLWREAPGFRGLEDIRLSYQKPAALIYLDDRAMRFEGPGTFPTAEQIHRARPWNKQGLSIAVQGRGHVVEAEERAEQAEAKVAALQAEVEHCNQLLIDGEALFQEELTDNKELEAKLAEAQGLLEEMADIEVPAVVPLSQVTQLDAMRLDGAKWGRGAYWLREQVRAKVRAFMKESGQ